MSHPIDKDEIIKVFHNNCRENGEYSKLDIKSFAKALQEIADIGVRRLLPSVGYLKQISKYDKEPKMFFGKWQCQNYYAKFIAKARFKDVW